LGNKKIYYLVFLCLLFLFCAPQNVWPKEKKAYDPEITPFLYKLFNERNQLLITNQPQIIKKYYLTQEKASLFALQHEVMRSQYLATWARKRGIKIVNAIGVNHIKRIEKMGNIAKVYLHHTAKISYIYPNEPEKTQSFGIGTRHHIKLKKVNDQWFVVRESYIDPIEEDYSLVPSTVESLPESLPPYQPEDNWRVFSGKGQYKREKAVLYAIKYAGAAWGAGNNHRYNPKYQDFTYMGGDCTNFASQVLGDPKEGGGLPMDKEWFYQGTGSNAWVHTNSFKEHLLKNGYGQIIAEGSFAEVHQPTKTNPGGALAKLQPGDLIGYKMNGDIKHFSIVVGRDHHGYVLVNSHTGDRNHVPWDLGWNNKTQYILIHIND